MAADYIFKISGAAREDIESINKYIFKELCNLSAVRELNSSFREAIRLACSNPHMCPRVKSNFVKNAALRKIPVKNYIIFYKPDNELHEILVVRVLYGMRNLEEDYALLLEAYKRLAKHSDEPDIPMDDVMARHGISEEDLAQIGDVEIE